MGRGRTYRSDWQNTGQQEVEEIDIMRVHASDHKNRLGRNQGPGTGTRVSLLGEEGLAGHAHTDPT